MRVAWNEKGGKAETIDSIFRDKLNTYEDYRELLSFMWEGIIIEYLRKIGRKISNFREDPRITVLRHWMQDERFQVKGFGRVYVPITSRRSEIKKWTSNKTLKVSTFLKAMREKEKIMKVMERKVTNNDYRTTLIFFRVLSEIRVLEDNFRTYLLNEIIRSHEAEANEIELRRRTVASFSVQNKLMKEYLEETETDYATQALYRDIANDMTSTCGWYEDTQKKMVQDAFAYDDEIKRLSELLRLEKLKNTRQEMKFEDLQISHERLVEKLDVDVQKMRDRLISELHMSQLECKEQRRLYSELQIHFLEMRDRKQEEIERFRMNMEEVDQKFGKRRRIVRKKKKIKTGKGKKGLAASASIGSKRRAGKVTKLPAINSKGRRQNGRVSSSRSKKGMMKRSTSSRSIGSTGSRGSAASKKKSPKKKKKKK